MTIRFTKYVDIISGVGGNSGIPNREFIGRLFTTNELLPTSSFIEFDSASEVGSYFGTNSVEYFRAVFYFGWISKNITTPQTISYARWVDVDQAPMIFGAPLTTTLTGLKLITDGSFTLTLGTQTNHIASLDFSGASNLAGIASILQTAIRAAPGDTQWSSATVTYNATRGSFDFVGGSAVNATIAVSAGTTGTNIATIMGWLPQAIGASPGAIWSDGKTAETITETLIASANASNNFGSFLFIPALTLDQIVEAATWNNTQNVLYQYMVPVANLSDANTYRTALGNLAGVGVTLAPLSTEYPEQVPMMILAATDYNLINSAQNYMFQQFNLTPSVTTDSDSDAYDALRINYYGLTQQAGVQIAFYQRGVLMGLSTNPLDMNTYANEQWFKDAAGVAIMNLLLAVSRVPANAAGTGQILSVLQQVINQALANGVISVGKTLTATQKLAIAGITGDPNAWYQVQGIGYWVNCVIRVVEVNDAPEYEAVYTLVYSKDDVIRKVSGSQILI